MPLQKHVWEVMETNYKTVLEDTVLEKMIDILVEDMRTNPSVQGLVVVDAKGRFKGSISFKEILSHMKGLFDASCQVEKESALLSLFSDRCRIDSGKKVHGIMQDEHVKISPNDKLLTAMRKLLDDRVLMLPVVEGNRPVGVLYLRDVFLLMKELLKK